MMAFKTVATLILVLVFGLAFLTGPLILKDGKQAPGPQSPAPEGPAGGPSGLVIIAALALATIAGIKVRLSG